MPIGKANADIFYEPVTQGIRVGTDTDYVYTEYYGFNKIDTSNDTYTQFLPAQDDTLKSPFAYFVNTNGSYEYKNAINNYNKAPFIDDGKLIWYGERRVGGVDVAHKYTFDPASNEWAANQVQEKIIPDWEYINITSLINSGGNSGSGGNTDDSSNGKTRLSDNGVEVEGKRLISRGSDRVISIGDNSIKFGNEAVGNQTMWATDQNGVVDINITNGTDLLINGVSVQGQIDDNKSAIQTNTRAIDSNRSNINNLGDGVAASTALTSALSALPTAATDAPFSCGVGSGAYSSRVAMGVGCAAKLQERLSLNVGGSTVFGGSSNYGGGSLDNVAVRGGFVFKLGKIESPAANNRQLQSQLNEVKQENAAIKAKYSTIEQQNAAITQQNKALMARLERLEAIALGIKPAATMASLK